MHDIELSPPTDSGLPLIPLQNIYHTWLTMFFKPKVSWDPRPSQLALARGAAHQVAQRTARDIKGPEGLIRGELCTIENRAFA